MKLSDIRTGTKLELEVYNELNEKIAIIFVSQFETATDERVLIIAAPISEGAIYPVHIGWSMNVYFTVKDDLFCMKVKVAGRQKKDNIAFLKVVLLSEIVKVQRRQFFRFEYLVPIRYRVVGPVLEEQNEEIPFRSTVTRDLSGGGLSILVEEKLELGSLVECELMISEAGIVLFTGKVVRSVKSDFNAKYGFEAGISFCQIENRDIEAIIKFIFTEQRRLRKKGLI